MFSVCPVSVAVVEHCIIISVGVHVVITAIRRFRLVRSVHVLVQLVN